jgi:hypothetical protein
LGLATAIALGASQATAALLAVDVNDRTAVSDVGNTVAGYSAYTLSGTTAAVPTSSAVVDGYTIAVTAVNAAGSPLGGIDDRDRAAPTTAPTLNQMYDDFIFTASGVGEGGGIDLAIDSAGALAANAQYLFSIYAYDNDSSLAPTPRTADWTDGNNGNALVVTTSFTGGVSPPADDTYKFTGVVRTDASGNLLLHGRNTTPNGTTGSITPGVFLNGFEINLVPEPAALALAAVASLFAVAAERRRR